MQVAGGLTCMLIRLWDQVAAVGVSSPAKSPTSEGVQLSMRQVGRESLILHLCTCNSIINGKRENSTESNFSGY